MDRYDQSLHNRRTGATTQQDPTSTSPRLGLSWLPLPQWTFYANVGRSFRPNVGVDVAGAGFSPESGRSMELGASGKAPTGAWVPRPRCSTSASATC